LHIVHPERRRGSQPQLALILKNMDKSLQIDSCATSGCGWACCKFQKDNPLVDVQKFVDNVEIDRYENFNADEHSI
jgi:hypothetical protein